MVCQGLRVDDVRKFKRDRPGVRMDRAEGEHGQGEELEGQKGR